MTRQDAIAKLILDVLADIQGYDTLAGMLEEQFHAALRHDTDQLCLLADDIVELVDIMDQRREERLTLIHALTGEQAPHNIDGVLAQLNPMARASLSVKWQELESKVRECKQRNTRNCELIVEQNTIMQQVLHGDGGLYADA